MANNRNHDWWSGLGVYLGASAVLHLVWEIVQLPLYTIWRTGTAREIAFAVVHCTGGDVIIAAVSLLVAYLAFGHRVHPLANLQSVLIAALVVGIGYTIYSEWLNTEVRKSWGYTELMPIMPWIGVGLSPVLQWVIVPALAMLAAGLRVRNGRPKAQSE